MTLLPLALCLVQATELEVPVAVEPDAPYVISHSGMRYVTEGDFAL